MHIQEALFALAIIAATAATTSAQTPVPLPKNDAAVTLGWFGSRYPGLDRYERWHSSVLTGVSAGHYWNDHFKSEMEAGWLTRVNADSYDTLTLPDGQANYHTTYRFADAIVSLGQIYQFGENAWVHPFVGLGVDVEFLRSTENRPAQTVSIYFPSAPVPPGGTPRTISLPAFSARDSSVKARPFVQGGLKMYASDNVFFSTEWKLGFGGGVHHALWKTGLGFDF